jgi:predicted ATP-grasp superfamily ATP-dependent carboligase
MKYFLIEERMKNKNLEGYTLIEGIPTLGLVGTIVSQYLIKELKMENIGYFELNYFQNMRQLHFAEILKYLLINV